MVVVLLFLLRGFSPFQRPERPFCSPQTGLRRGGRRKAKWGSGAEVILVTMTSIDRVYAGRLSGMIVRNPDGDAIGRARDVVVRLRPSGAPSRALGLVLQLTDKRRVFVPMGRITAVEPNEILLN